jgi:hypothetical protein
VLPIEAAGEMNTGKHRNRITDKEGLGPAGNGRDSGFFCHPAIAADPEDKTAIGRIDLYLRGRKAKKAKRRHSEREAFETKEIYRRAERAIAAMRKLGGAVNATAVRDREGGLYESYALLKANGVNWVIRANHDRKVRAGNGESVRLKEYPAGLAAAERIVLQRRGKKTETVPMELKFARVEVERPERKPKQEREKYPETVTMRVVQAKQKAGTVRPGEAGVEWNLYTGRPSARNVYKR